MSVANGEIREDRTVPVGKDSSRGHYLLRQRDRHGRASAQRRVDGDRAAVELDDVLGGVESDAALVRLEGYRVLAAIQPIEYEIHVFPRDADAVIFDREDRLIPVVLGERDFDFAAGRIFESVIDDIGDGRLQALQVGRDRERRRHVEAQRDLFLTDDVAQVVEQRAHHFRQVHGGFLESQVFDAGFRRHEHLIDDAESVADPGDAGIDGLFGFDPDRRVALQALQSVADAGEGRAQLMLGDRQEVILHVLDFDQAGESAAGLVALVFLTERLLDDDVHVRRQDDEQSQMEEQVRERYRIIRDGLVQDRERRQIRADDPSDAPGHPRVQIDGRDHDREEEQEQIAAMDASGDQDEIHEEEHERVAVEVEKYPLAISAVQQEIGDVEDPHDQKERDRGPLVFDPREELREKADDSPGHERHQDAAHVDGDVISLEPEFERLVFFCVRRHYGWMRRSEPQPFEGLFQERLAVLGLGDVTEQDGADVFGVDLVDVDDDERHEELPRF